MNLNTLSSTDINNIPSVRIPLNADYWLHGSGTGSTIGSNMSADQYQNMIVAMVYYLMHPNNVTTSNTSFSGTANGCVVILDLHWNYSSGAQTSFSYTNENDTPSGQCCMALTNNSIAFWNSMCTTFGIKSSGSQNLTTCTINTSNTGDGGGSTYTLSTDDKKNIFFELYNEPYLEQVNTNGHNEYDSDFSIYINGSESVLGTTITISDSYNASGVPVQRSYNVEGMGTLYNNIRSTNDCINVIILGGAENYAYFAGYNYVTYADQNNFLGSYNCFTKLNQAVLNGLQNVIANLHPYSNGYEKFPGYMYNINNTNTSNVPNNGNSNPALCNFLEALQSGTNPFYTAASSIPYPSQYNPSPSIQYCSSFQISFPIICTEFGMYNLPWINASGKATYTSAYNADLIFTLSQAPSSNWAGTQTTTGSYSYSGEYYDANGIPTSAPCIVGYFENFNKFNISYTIWALVPRVVDFNQDNVLQVNYSYSGMPTTTLPLLADSNMTNLRFGQNGFDMNFCFQKYYLNNVEVVIVEPPPPPPAPYPWSGNEIKGYYYWTVSSGISINANSLNFATNVTSDQVMTQGIGSPDSYISYTTSGTYTLYSSLPAGLNSIFIFTGQANINTILTDSTVSNCYNNAYYYLSNATNHYLIGLVIGGGTPDTGGWTFTNIEYLYAAVTMSTIPSYTYVDSGGTSHTISGNGNLTNNYNCLVFDIECYNGNNAPMASDFTNLFDYIKNGAGSTFNQTTGSAMKIIVTMSHSISNYNAGSGTTSKASDLVDLYASSTYDYISPQLYTVNAGTTNEYCANSSCDWTSVNGTNNDNVIDNLKTNSNFTTYGLNMILPSINLTCLYSTGGSNNNSPANLYWSQTGDNTSYNESQAGFLPIENTYGTVNRVQIGDYYYNQYTSNYTDTGAVDFFNTIFGASGQTLGGYIQWVNGSVTVSGHTYT